MNIHHLELFYYVAKNGGITAASRNMPYGIQQAAISGQVAQLEEFLGVVLFHRRPFALTPSGEKLLNFITPFFQNLESVAKEVRGGDPQHLRIAASEIVMQAFLPDMLQETRKQFPKLRVTLREGYHPETVDWLERREIDVALGLLGGKPPPGIRVVPLFDLPLALIVPQQSPLQSPEPLWRQDHIGERLITTPSNHVICSAFQAGLARLKVDWSAGIEVSSVALVETYVVKGYGIGVTVKIPNQPCHPQVRLLPLEDFPRTTFGALWHGFRSPVLDHFLKVVEQSARRQSAEPARLPVKAKTGPRPPP
jgi:DNA-binding transcriptional LysR family regulator